MKDSQTRWLNYVQGKCSDLDESFIYEEERNMQERDMGIQYMLKECTLGWIFHVLCTLTLILDLGFHKIRFHCDLLFWLWSFASHLKELYLRLWPQLQSNSKYCRVSSPTPPQSRGCQVATTFALDQLCGYGTPKLTQTVSMLRRCSNRAKWTR